MNRKLTGILLLTLGVVPASLAAPGARRGSSYDHYLRGLLLDKQGDVAKAREEYEKAVQAAPGSAYLHRALADASLRMGRVAEAAEEIDKAVALNPSDHDTQILAGEIYFNKGETGAARRHLEKALEINPQSEEALLNLAYLCAQTEPRQAVEYYKRYLLLHPGTASVDERLAVLYQQMGENDKAESAWRELLSHSEDSLKADLSLGQIYEIKGDTRSAVGYYEKARQASPRSLPLLLHLGQMYFRLNRSTDAAAAFEEAEKVAPDNLAAHFWLSLIAENRRDWAQAAFHMDRVSRALPEPGILLRLSYYQAQGGDMSGSVDTLKRLRSLDPTNPDYIYYEAVGEETAGRLKDAADHLKEFLASRPEDAEAHFELGTVLDRIGRFEDAVPHLQEAIRLKPHYDVAMNYLGYSWAEKGVHLKEAEALIQEALAIDPSDPAYRDSLGWVYYQEGRYADARSELSKAVAAMRDPLIEEHLGDALFKLGEKAEAYQAWEKAAGPGGPGRELLRKIREVRREVPAKDRARFSVERAHDVWSSLPGFSGMARVTVRKAGSPEAKVAVRIDYQKGRLLRAEPLSSGGAAGYLSLENGRWTDALIGSPTWDEGFQDIAEKIDDFLSGRLLEGFEKGSVLRAADDEAAVSANGLQMLMGTERAQVKEVRWGTPERATLTMEYRRRDDPHFPSRMVYENPASRLTVKIDFDNLVFSEPK